MTKPKYYLCGGCGHLHPFGWTGDCRVDENRFTYDQLDEKHGKQDVDFAAGDFSRTDGWVEIDEDLGEPI